MQGIGHHRCCSPLVLATVNLATLATLATPAAAREIVLGPIVQSPGETGLIIAWEQDEPSAPEVRYGATPAYGASATTSESERHEVVLAGLDPGTTYHYAIYDGDVPLTEDLTFQTAVSPGTPFRFVIYGDTRSRPEVHAAVVAGVGGEEGARFTLQTGDLVADGEVEDQWLQYFATERPVQSRVPVYPVIGNHDEHAGAAELYTEHFALPPDSPAPEQFYSFDYGGVHVLALDGHVNVWPLPTCIDEMDVWIAECFTAAQLQWIEDDLRAAASDPEIDHIIVATHIGPYSSKPGRSGSQQMRRLLPLFREMGVSLIVSGHDHYYERGMAGIGIPYVITGAGGAPLYELGSPSKAPHDVVYNESIEHYVVVDVDGEELNLTAKTLGGRVLDSFTVRKITECSTDEDCQRMAPPPDCAPPVKCGLGERCAFTCEVEGANPFPDLAPDEDAGPEAAADVPVDTAPDAGPEAAPEVLPDAGRESSDESMDVASEPGPAPEPAPPVIGVLGGGCAGGPVSPGPASVLGLLGMLALAVRQRDRRAREPRGHRAGERGRGAEQGDAQGGRAHGSIPRAFVSARSVYPSDPSSWGAAPCPACRRSRSGRGSRCRRRGSRSRGGRRR